MNCEYCGSHNSADKHDRCVFCGAQIKYRRQYSYTAAPASAMPLCSSVPYADAPNRFDCDGEPLPFVRKDYVTKSARDDE